MASSAPVGVDEAKYNYVVRCLAKQSGIGAKDAQFEVTPRTIEALYTFFVKVAAGIATMAAAHPQCSPSVMPRLLQRERRIHGSAVVVDHAKRVAEEYLSEGVAAVKQHCQNLLRHSLQQPHSPTPAKRLEALLEPLGVTHKVHTNTAQYHS